jgi:hypothetical protein
MHKETEFVVVWLADMLHTQEVPGLYLGPDMG